MEDIYDDSSTNDYIDGVVGGVVLGKFLTEESDCTYKEGYDDNGNKIDYTSAWKKMFTPPTKGISGLIAAFVRISGIVIAVASIALLLYLGFTQGFNF